MSEVSFTSNGGSHFYTDDTALYFSFESAGNNQLSSLKAFVTEFQVTGRKTPISEIQLL